jgi:hypothetical protein
MPAKNRRLILLAILALAVFLRVVVAFTLGDTVPPGKDETSYFTLGVRVATGHGFSFDRPWYPFTPAETPTAHWSFLYALVVAAVYSVAGLHPLAVRLVSAVVSGLLLPWLTYRLAVRVTGGRGQEADRRSLTPDSCGLTPVLAAFLSAVYLYFVLYGAMVQTEAFYICAVLWSLERALALTPPQPPDSGGSSGRAAPQPPTTGEPGSPHGWGVRGATLGLSLGIATLLRQSILPWVVVLFAWLLWQAVRGSVGPTGVLRADRPPRLASPLPSQGEPVLSVSKEGRGVGDNSSNSCNSWRSGVLREDRPQQVALPHEIANSSNSCNSWQISVASLFIAGLVLLACIAPFTIRNTIVYGNFLLLNSNAGYAMYSAQHPMHGINFQEFAAAPLPQDLANKGLNEAQWDKELMRRGIGFVLAEPGRYALLSLSRIPDYFEFWPTADTTLLNNIGRVGSFGLFLPFMLYGLFLSVRRSPLRHSLIRPFADSPFALLYLFIVFYSLLHILTWAMPRYRLPVDAVLLIFAAAGVTDLWNKMRASIRFKPEAQLGER